MKVETDPCLKKKKQHPEEPTAISREPVVVDGWGQYNMDSINLASDDEKEKEDDGPDTEVEGDRDQPPQGIQVGTAQVGAEDRLP